jgi:hypothetical protein
MLLNNKLIAFTFFAAQFSFGQANTVATGGNATGASGSVSYTVGQIDYSWSSAATGSINQGVQQPYEISSSNGLNDETDEISLIVGPNPTIDNLTLTFLSDETVTYRFELFDENGKVLLAKSQLKKVETIDMSHYSIGTYQLKISASNRSQKSFKIIKN